MRDITASMSDQRNESSFLVVVVALLAGVLSVAAVPDFLSVVLGPAFLSVVVEAAVEGLSDGVVPATGVLSVGVAGLVSGLSLVAAPSAGLAGVPDGDAAGAASTLPRMIGKPSLPPPT